MSRETLAKRNGKRCAKALARRSRPSLRNYKKARVAGKQNGGSPVRDEIVMG